MKNRKEYLKHLLSRDKWTIREAEKALDYFENDDLSEVEEVAEEEFNADVEIMRKSLDRRRSENLLKKIHDNIESPQKSSFVQAVRVHRLKILLAASAIFLAGLGYFKRDLFYSVPMRSVVTGINERKRVRLPDNSLITLEPATRLSFPGRFEGSSREVQLSGEAFFEVTKNSSRPFVIHTQYINTMVLGTSFNVVAYDTGKVSVVVSSGSVKVQTVRKEKELQAVIIHANQQVVYNNSTNEIEKSTVPEEAAFYMKRHLGRFGYKGIAVEKVVEDMSRYYHVSVTVDKKLEKCVFYGHFNAGDKLDKALNLVALALNATVVRNKNGYVITGGDCR